MSAVLTVARREIAERKTIFLAAAVASLIPLVVPLLNPQAGAAGRQGTALFLSFAFAWGTSLLLGSTVLGRDLTERRLGFYFSRPLPPLALWAGKVLASLLLAVGSAALVLVPMLLVDRSLRPLVGDGALAFVEALLFGGSLVLLAGALFGSVSARSRSLWIAVDVLLAGLVLALLYLTYRMLLGVGYVILHEVNPFPPLIALCAVVVVALLLATAAQVVRGRVDVVAAHRAQSLVLWAALVPVALAVTAGAYWLSHPRVADLLSVQSVSAAPEGPWAVVTGPARGRGASFGFVLDTATGRFLRLGALHQGARFSADGKRVAWLKPRIDFDKLFLDLYRADLDRPAPRPVFTGVTLTGPGGWAQLDVSPSGKRASVAFLDSVSVFDLDTGRTLTSAKVTGDLFRSVFPDDDHVRIYVDPVRGKRSTREPEVRKLSVLELDVPGKKLVTLGSFETEPTRMMAAFRPGPKAERVVVFEGPRRGALRDGRTGALLAKLFDEPSERWVSGALTSCLEMTNLQDGSPMDCASVRSLSFLSTGDLALAIGSKHAQELRIYSSTGAPLRTIPLGTGRYVSLGAEIATGQLLVGIATSGPGSENFRRGPWKTVSVDTATGAVTAQRDGLHPAESNFWWGREDGERSGVTHEGDAARLLLDDTGRLVRVDLATGAKAVVVGAH